MSESSEVPVRVAPTRMLVDEWALVLVTEGLSPRVTRASDGFILGVPGEELERAVMLLSAYENENRLQPERDDISAGSAHVYAGLAVSVGLLAFFLVSGEGDRSTQWFARGGADAERILLGELWRTVTALTLHADLGHLMANAIAGAIFVSAVCRTQGAGFGCALVLLTGAGGNFFNALLHGSLHVSVGASTAVFGAVGLLSGGGLARRRQRGARGRRVWMPIAAGLAFLAMVGMGERVDLWAHLLGFVLGGILGILVTCVMPRPPGLRMQWTLGSAAVATIISCWALALR